MWLGVTALAVLGVIAPAGAARAKEPPGAVVLVGAPGLSWTDIDAVTTPTLHGLALAGGVASLTVRAVRSRSCAVDGWLTLSAGRRAADLVDPCRAPQVVGKATRFRTGRTTSRRRRPTHTARFRARSGPP